MTSPGATKQKESTPKLYESYHYNTQSSNQMINTKENDQMYLHTKKRIIISIPYSNTDKSRTAVNEVQSPMESTVQHDEMCNSPSGQVHTTGLLKAFPIVRIKAHLLQFRHWKCSQSRHVSGFTPVEMDPMHRRLYLLVFPRILPSRSSFFFGLLH